MRRTSLVIATLAAVMTTRRRFLTERDKSVLRWSLASVGEFPRLRASVTSHAGVFRSLVAARPMGF
jgi:hypothetical protein